MLKKITVLAQKVAPDIRQIISNTGWLLAQRLLQMGVGLFVGVWVARYLGPEEFGLFNYAIAFCGLFSPIVTLGLDSIVIREVVHDISHKDEILGTAFALKLAGGSVGFILVFGSISLLRPNDSFSLLLVSVISIVMILRAFDTIDFWFQSQVQSKYSVIAKSVSYLFISLARVVLITVKATLVYFAWARVAESFLNAVGLVYNYQSQGNSIKAWRWSFERAKLLLKSSWPILLTGFAIFLYMKIDIIMLSEIAGDDDVGFYSAAVRLSELWYFIPMSLNSSMFPSILEAKKIDESLYYKKLQILFNIMSLISYAIAIPMTFLSTKVVLVLYGQDYIVAGIILSIHIWSSLFVFMGVVQNSWNVAEDLTELYLQRTVIGAIMNIILNFLLIPRYAGVGAAVATVISYSFTGSILNAFDPRTRKIFLLQAKSLLPIGPWTISRD